MKIVSIGSLNETHVEKKVRVRGLLKYENKSMPNGDTHIYGNINDATGYIHFSVFNNSKWLKKLSSIEPESYVVVEGVLETVTGGKSKKLKSFKTITEVTVVSPDVTEIDEGAVKNRILKACKSIEDEKIRKLTMSFVKRLTYFTSIYSLNNFCYKGGLATYTARVLDMVDMLLGTTDNVYSSTMLPLKVDRSNLIAGAILHSVGALLCYEQTKDGLFCETDWARLEGKDNCTRRVIDREIARMGLSMEDSRNILHIIETCTKGQDRWKRDESAKTYEAVLLNHAILFVLASESFNRLSNENGVNVFTTDFYGRSIKTSMVIEEEKE